MSDEDAIRTVRERGILMQEAVPAGVGGMSAVLGMNAEEIKRGCGSPSPTSRWQIITVRDRS